MITTTEHLQLIKAECERLLAIAEKRTQGGWDAFQRDSEVGTNYCRITFSDRNSDSLHGYCGEVNATFIAACAGRAEAGWEATIAAIDFLSRPQSSFGHSRSELAMIEPILAAWPMELLTK
jgi:hypothetical protein